MTTITTPRKKLRKPSYIRKDLQLKLNVGWEETKFQFTAVTLGLSNGSYPCEDLLRKLVRALEAKGFSQQARKFATIYMKLENSNVIANN